MIQMEYIEAENRERRFSDNNVKIRKIETGELYNDAADIVPCPYTYEESLEPIDVIDEPADANDYENALNELGVSV